MKGAMTLAGRAESSKHLNCHIHIARELNLLNEKVKADSLLVTAADVGARML